MDEVIKYYVWKDEETAWDSEESYQNYEPADGFRTVWERD